MAAFTKHIILSKTTTTGSAETVVDRSNLQPLKWFSIVIEDSDAYIGINETASASTMLLKQGESYTTPERVRVTSISVLRPASTNVTVRGSAWY